MSLKHFLVAALAFGSLPWAALGCDRNERNGERESPARGAMSSDGGQGRRPAIGGGPRSFDAGATEDPDWENIEQTGTTGSGATGSGTTGTGTTTGSTGTTGTGTTTGSTGTSP